MLMDAIDTAALPAGVLARIATETARFSARYGEGRERRVLLIGGSGYIGCPVTAHLLAHGGHVRNLDCLVYDHGAAMLGFLSHPRYEFIAGDMGDRSILDRALEGVTDVVLLAGLVGDPITRAFPEASARINDDAVMGVIATLNGRGLNKVIFVSTCSNYGMIGEHELADEQFALNPLSLYAKSKVAAEQAILERKGRVDYAATILRFATAFGVAPRMRFDLTVNEFTREMYCDRELVVFDADTWRPYCHVSDFARLVARVLEYPVEAVSFETFNAGGDSNNFTKRSIVEMISKRLPGRRVSYRDNSSDPRNYRVSFEKVANRLQFKPRMSVADGIDEIVWALEHHMFDDVAERPVYYGNRALPGLGHQLPLNRVPSHAGSTWSLTRH